MLMFGSFIVGCVVVPDVGGRHVLRHVACVHGTEVFVVDDLPSAWKA